MPDETSSASVNRELTSRIVAAYVRHSQIVPDRLAVHEVITNLGNSASESRAERTPAVPIRRSVRVA